MRLGIFGGTFNPVHLGHLLLAETARETLKLDQVLFIPTARPPHKATPDLLDGALRVKLLRLAIRTHPAFRVSDLELRRRGVSYTVDTLRLVKQRFPKAALFLLIGQDLLAVRWRSWQEIRRLATVVGVRRLGAPVRRSAQVRWLDMPQIEIASSDIRRRIKAGRSIRYLVPETVERCIMRHRLYRRGLSRHRAPVKLGAPFSGAGRMRGRDVAPHRIGWNACGRLTCGAP